MKFQSIFNSLMVCTALSTPILGLSDNLAYVSSSEMHRFVCNAIENLKMAVSQILSIQESQRTFENFLQPWNKTAAVFKNEMNAIAKCQDPYLAGSAKHDLFAFWMELVQYPELQSALKDVAVMVLNNSDTNAYQRYVSQRFLENAIISNNTDHFLYLKGIAHEKNDQCTDFKILNLNSSNLTNEQSAELVKNIVSGDADVVLVQGTPFEEDAYSLHEQLKDAYSHFYILESPSSAGQPLFSDNIFIASKHLLENVQYHPFRTEGSIQQEGYFDFVIKNGANALSHVYCADFHDKDQSVVKLGQILETMQTDFLKSLETDYMPFLLCGDLRNKSADKLINDYFCEENGTSSSYLALLLRYLPIYPTDEISQGFTLQSTLHSTSDSYYGLLTSVKKYDFFSLESVLKNSMNYWDGNSILLADNISTSGNKDSKSDGSSHVDGRVSYTKESDNGACCTVEINGYRDRDKDGNKSSGVGVGVSIDF